MTNNEFIKLAKAKVSMLHNFTDIEEINPDDVFLVWYAKTLQNHKALLATPVFPDVHYYEATYNGDKGELYIDVYTKEVNKCYKIKEEKAK